MYNNIIVMLFALEMIWQSSFFKHNYVIVKFKTTHLAQLDALFFIMLCYWLVRVFIA